MAILPHLILFFIVILINACYQSSDGECQLLDFYAGMTCLCQPCPKIEGCPDSPLSKARNGSRHQRSIAVPRCRWSQQKQPKTTSPKLLSVPDGPASIFFNITGWKVSDMYAPHINLSSWFQRNPCEGLERSVVRAVGIKRSCWVGIALLLLLVLPHVSLLLCAKIEQRVYCYKNLSNFTSQQNSDLPFTYKKSISNDSGINTANEYVTKFRSFGDSEIKIKQLLSNLSKRIENFGKHWIYSFHDEVLNCQAGFNHSLEILILQPLSTPRLASYQRFPPIPVSNSISFVLLAQAGFKYTGEGTRVSCEGCSSNLDISDLCQDPRSQCYHGAGCEFSTDCESPRQSSSDDHHSQASDNSESIGATAAVSHSTINSDPGTSGANEFSNARDTTQDSNSAPSQHPTKAPEECTGGSIPNESIGIIDTDWERIYPDGHSIQSMSENQLPTGNANPIGAEESIKTWKGPVSAGAHAGPECGGQSPSPQTSQTTGANGFAGDADSSHVGAVGTERPNQTFMGNSGDASINNRHSRSSSFAVSGPRYRQDAKITSKRFYGTDHFETEFNLERHASDKVRVSNCEKNPGHLSYWSPTYISVENLPAFSACREFSKFLRLAAELTVRVVVSFTSPARKNWLDSTGISKKDKYRTGTGSAIRELLFDEDDAVIECDAEMTPQATTSPAFPTESRASLKKSPKKFKGGLPKAPLKAVRKYASSLKRRKCALYIETNRHIVFDDSEAAETQVEFFFDQPDRKSIYTFKVSRIMHDVSLEGSNRSVLVCMTSDFDFVHSLKAKRRELELLVGQFPRAVSEALLQHVFLIHHPHGGEKVCSFGKSVVRKYVLEKNVPATDTDKATSSGAMQRSKLTKIADLKQIPSDVSSTRKMLLYTADTCRGSSGAPVIAFTNTRSDRDGTPRLALNLWMHEGKEINGLLNVSALEACTAADLAPLAPRPRPQPVTLSLPAPGPVIRMSNPTYYVYSSLRKRLESFSCVLPHTFVHSIYDLAKGGFFYAGYDDCVRCFYCGVGLKRWSPDDDIYVEHQRLRPDCHFLILQMRAMGDSRRSVTTLGARNQPGAPSSPHHTSGYKLQPSCSQVSAKSSRPDSSKPTALGAASTCSGHNIVNVPYQVIPAYHVTGINYSNSSMNTQGLNNGDPERNLREGSGASTTNGDSDSRANPSTQPQLVDKSEFQVTMLQMENAILERPLTCKVCNSAPVKELYLPCGHVDSCTECTKNLDHCPTCCARIKATVKIYFA